MEDTLFLIFIGLVGLAPFLLLGYVEYLTHIEKTSKMPAYIKSKKRK